MDEFQTETGEVFPDADVARVLSQAIDEDTMGRIEDTDGLDLKDPREGQAYLPVKSWILQLDVKLWLRKHTRVKQAVKSPDDMVYGVDNAASNGTSRSTAGSHLCRGPLARRRSRPRPVGFLSSAAW